MAYRAAYAGTKFIYIGNNPLSMPCPLPLPPTLLPRFPWLIPSHMFAEEKNRAYKYQYQCQEFHDVQSQAPRPLDVLGMHIVESPSGLRNLRVASPPFFPW